MRSQIFGEEHSAEWVLSAELAKENERWFRVAVASILAAIVAMALCIATVVAWQADIRVNGGNAATCEEIHATCINPTEFVTITNNNDSCLSSACVGQWQTKKRKGSATA